VVRRRILVVLSTVVSIILLLAPSASAYEFTNGAYNNSSIGDGVLGVCFENNSPVYTHRAILLSGLQQWGTAKNITLNSNGRCDNDGSNVEVLWESGGLACWQALAWVPLRSVTYSSIPVNFNPNCGEGAFWWGGTNPVPNDKVDAYSSAFHEMGHAYGLHHEDDLAGQQLMESSTPCIITTHGRVTAMSDDDADGIRLRYQGLGDTGTTFNSSLSCIP